MPPLTPYLRPNSSAGCATNGKAITPSGGKLMPLRKSTTLEAKARVNLLMTSNFGIALTDKRLAFRGGERQQRDTARSFDGGCQHTLVTGAIAGNPARCHFSPFRNELGNHPQVLVIDGERLVCAKSTYPPAKHRPSPRRTTLFVVCSLPLGSWPSFELCHSFTTSLVIVTGSHRHQRSSLAGS